MQKESRISLLPAILVIVASLLSAYVTARVMLMQQAMVLQETREKSAGDAAHKEMQKIRQLSYELNGLAEQLIEAGEGGYNGYQLARIAEKIRDKGNELYFQAGSPFADNAQAVVRASQEYVALRGGDEAEREKLLNKVKESRKHFFSEYPKCMAEYQLRAVPGSVPGDALSQQLLKIMDGK